MLSYVVSSLVGQTHAQCRFGVDVARARTWDLQLTRDDKSQAGWTN